MRMIETLNMQELVLHCIDTLGPCSVATMRAHCLSAGRFVLTRSLHQARVRLLRMGAIRQGPREGEWQRVDKSTP